MVLITLGISLNGGLVAAGAKDPGSKTEFCGKATEGPCQKDEDCVVGGCSKHICQSKKEEPVMSTCEWRECYQSKLYGVNCVCLNNRCQWN